MNIYTIFISLTVALFLNTCASSNQTVPLGENVYTPVSKEVYDEIVAIDKKFFEAYNCCDIAIVDSLLSDDINFTMIWVDSVRPKLRSWMDLKIISVVKSREY